MEVYVFLSIHLDSLSLFSLELDAVYICIVEQNKSEQFNFHFLEVDIK